MCKPPTTAALDRICSKKRKGRVKVIGDLTSGSEVTEARQIAVSARVIS
jgi:hypothetical protein